MAEKGWHANAHGGHFCKYRRPNLISLASTAHDAPTSRLREDVERASDSSEMLIFINLRPRLPERAACEV